MEVNVKDDPTLTRLATVLGYRRRKARIVAAKSVKLMGLNWDGGCISRYAAMDLSSGATVQLLGTSIPHPMDNETEGAQVALTGNRAVVRTGVFLGKESMMTIYVHPDAVAGLAGGGL